MPNTTQPHNPPSDGCCQRCGTRTLSTSVSYFNTQHCCLNCIHTEKEHPQYEEARSVERQHVLDRDYNFPGIGLPAELAAKYPPAHNPAHAVSTV